ncbi:LamG-like jellyroll fold domain-containing protein [Corynebacterium yudongzhengii]|uniref:LamG-like jellyroll fold domain-containing protein n=1 Tax=Corynebacterium yudongzhengii TaxID=2080740 RepID=UPI001F480ED4|nr:LamG-like jellyroll fold domain-containing protein [Corynebacterium yudongzhengii]
MFYSEDYGEHLWDRLIRKNDQIFLTLGGHHHGAGYHVSTNDAGNQVINILQDYQMAYLGGNGLGGLIQFDLSGNTLDMTAFSPWVQSKDRSQLTQFDELLPDGASDSYSIPLNFDERFAGFNEEWQPGEEDDPDYTAVLRDTVSEGYTPHQITEADRPRSTEDYAHVEGTAVHWRPGMAEFNGKRFGEGEAVPAGSVVPDVVKPQNMTRVPLKPGTTEEMVTYTKDKHPLSADAGSLRFDEPTSDLAVSYFETAADAAINSENFENGYTLEAFLKLDENFNGDDNGWSNALIRNASGTDIDAALDDGDPAQMLGASNLRELRWYALGENGEGFSNWTHEVPKGRWMHVAVVNDPADKSVTMYVDGAPMMRDGYGPVGMAGEAFSWLLGTSAWEGIKQDGWYGSIGEVRMVDHPIGPDQWLTARAATAPETGSSAEKVALWAVVGGLIAIIAVCLGGAFAPLAEQIREMLRR